MIIKLPKELISTIYEYDSYKYDLWNECTKEIRSYIKRRNAVMFQYIHTNLPNGFDEYEFYEWLLKQTRQIIIYNNFVVIKKYKWLT